MKKNVYLMVFLFLFIAVIYGAPTDKIIHLSDAVIASAPGGMFYDHELIMFQLDLPCSVNYVVTDVYKNTVAAGKWESGTVSLPRLPRGVYEIYLTPPAGYTVEWRSTFSVVPPRQKLQNPQDFPFAFDAALDGAMPKYKGKEKGCPNQETMIGIALRSGIYTARTRTGWRQSGGKTDLTLLAEKKEICRKLKTLGINSTGMLEGPGDDSGSRNGRIPLKDGGKPNRTSVDDLFVIYHYCRDLASTLGADNLRYCEPFNEPDLKGYTAWELAAASKAAFLGFRDGDPQIKVLSSSFSQPVGPFVDTFLQSGMKYYIDAFNIHNYWFIPAYEAYIQPYREILKKYGLENTALFVTENGETAQYMAPGPKPKEKLSWSSGDRCQSREAEYAVAEWIAKTHFESLRCGVDMNYVFFLWPVFQSPMGDWGHLRNDSSAKPSLTVIANMAYYLGQGTYLGTYDPGKDMRGMLYAMPDGTQTLVFWQRGDWDITGKPTEYAIRTNTVTFPLKIADGHYPLINMYGTPLSDAIAANGKIKIEISTMPSYLPGIKGLTPQQPAAHRGDFGAVDDPGVDKTIVLRLISGNNMQPDSSGAFAKVTAANASFAVEIYNFGENEKTGTFDFEGSNVKVAGPKQITIAPKKSVVLQYTLQAVTGEFKTNLVVNGKFNGKQTTQSVMPLVFIHDPSLFVEVPFVNAMISKNWRPSANGKMIVTNPEPDVISFDVPKFTNTDRWICPEYLLQPGESLAGYVGMKFDFREFCDNHRQEKGITLVASTEKEKGERIDNGFRTSNDQEWHEYSVYFSVDKQFLSRVKQFRIGGGSRTDALRWEIRNLRLLKLKDNKITTIDQRSDL